MPHSERSVLGSRAARPKMLCCPGVPSLTGCEGWPEVGRTRACRITREPSTTFWRQTWPRLTEEQQASVVLQLGVRGRDKLRAASGCRQGRARRSGERKAYRAMRALGNARCVRDEYCVAPTEAMKPSPLTLCRGIGGFLYEQPAPTLRGMAQRLQQP